MPTAEVPQLPDYSHASLEGFFLTLAVAFDADRQQAVASGDFEALRVRWIGRKQGLMNQVAEVLKGAPNELRREVGTKFNAFKKSIESGCNPDEEKLSPTRRHAAAGIDVTLPGTLRAPGIPHPLLETMQQIEQIFHRLGYSTSTGPQVETDFYNFEALNFPRTTLPATRKIRSSSQVSKAARHAIAS